MKHKVHFIVFPLLIKLTVAVNVELVSIIPYGARVSTALMYTGAAMDVAVQKANHRHNGTLNVSVSFLYADRVLGSRCADTAYTIIDLVTHYYYKDRPKDACMAIMATSTSYKTEGMH